VSQLRIITEGFSPFAIWNDVIDGAVIKSLDLILADLAYWCLLVQIPSKLEVEESGFD
jgi:hypothetical protein